MKKILIGALSLLIILSSGFYIYKLKTTQVKNIETNDIVEKDDTITILSDYTYKDKELGITTYNLAQNSITGMYKARIDHIMDIGRVFDENTGYFFYKSDDGMSELDGTCFAYEDDGSCLRNHIYKDNVFDITDENELIYKPDSSDVRFSWIYDQNSKTIFVFEEIDNTITYYSINPNTKEKNKIKTLINPSDESFWFGSTAVNTEKDKIAQINHPNDLPYMNVIYTDIHTGDTETYKVEKKFSKNYGSDKFSPDLEKIATSEYVDDKDDNSHDEAFVIYDIKSNKRTVVPLHKYYGISNFIPVWSPDSEGIFMVYGKDVKYANPEKEGDRLVYFGIQDNSLKLLLNKDKWGIHIEQVSNQGNYLLLSLFDLIDRSQNKDPHYYINTKNREVKKLITKAN